MLKRPTDKQFVTLLRNIQETSLADLSDMIGLSPQYLTIKLSRGYMKLPDYVKICDVLGFDFEMRATLRSDPDVVVLLKPDVDPASITLENDEE